MPVIESGNTIPGTRGRPLRFAGTPSDDSTYLGRAAVGTLLVNVTAGVLYVCTLSTATNITWVKVGSQ